MKRFWVCMMVVMISLGVVAVMGGCGGGGGGGGTPKSSSAYAGSNMPSVIDSTSVWDYAYLTNDIGYILTEFGENPAVDWYGTSGTYTEGGSMTQSIDGSGGGTYTETREGRYTGTSTPDGDVFTYEQNAYELWKGSFDSWIDSGSDYPYALEGEGSFYAKNEYSQSYTSSSGGIMLMAPAGTESGSNYINYSGFQMNPEWDSDYLYNLDGHLGQKYTADYVAGLCDSTVDADFSESEVSTVDGAAYYGLLNTKATVAYDGSDSTVTGSGTLCGEGDAELNISGCVDFVIDAVWENTDMCGDGGGPSGFPTSGTIKVSTMDANAMYDFGASSDPWCFKYLVDADNNGAYEYSSMECD